MQTVIVTDLTYNSVKVLIKVIERRKKSVQLSRLVFVWENCSFTLFIQIQNTSLVLITKQT